MIRANRWKLACAAILGGLLGIAPAIASAATCETDADCPQGAKCEQVCTQTCTGPGICAEACHGECIEGVESAQSAPELWGPEGCQTDADCPADFTCEEKPTPCKSGGTDCACPDCPPGETCPPCECDAVDETPADCGGTVNVCIYHPTACQADADCPASFECHKIESCGGAGCVCSQPVCACPSCPPGQECPPCDCPDAGPANCDCPDVAETECTVEAAWCVPQEIPCESDSDCPDSWSCASIDVPCLCPACACPADQDCPECACNCPDPVQRCLPKGWDQVLISGGAEPGAPAGVPETGNEATSVLLGEGGGGAAGIPAAGAPQGGDAVAQGGGAGQRGNESSGSGGGGCASTSGPVGFGGVLVVTLFAMAAVVRRRRPRVVSR